MTEHVPTLDLPATLVAAHNSARNHTTAKLLSRATELGLRMFANDNISEVFANDEERSSHQQEVERAVDNLLRVLLIDVDNDHNTQGTAKRIAKMYINEIFRGRYHPEPAVTYFPNAENLDQLYMVGPITLNSCCSHHLVPIIGKAWVGVLPGDTVIGLSKFHRMIDHIARRPQIQEELTVQIGNAIQNLIEPRGLGVIIDASHLCTTIRGVKDQDSNMVTSVLRGAFLEPTLRTEFLSFVNNKR